MATLSDILERHGISPTASRSTARVGAELRARSEREGVEFAAMLDAASGARLGDILRGSQHSTDVSAHLRAMRKMRRYIQIYTHPRSTPISDGDLQTLLREQQIAAMVVVGVDRSSYVISVSPGAEAPPAPLVAQALRDELADRLVALLRQVVAGADLQTAEQEVRHQACSVVAARFNLRYDRLRRAAG